MADNGVECSVVMEKTRFDARETFPDFKLVFTNKGEARSMAGAEEPASLTLSIADTSRFREGRITVRFRNEGNEPVRIPDEINDETEAAACTQRTWKGPGTGLPGLLTAVMPRHSTRWL